MSELAALAAPHVRADARRFYVFAASACVAIAFLGFTPTFWWPIVRGAPAQPFIVSLHGFLFFGWTLLFLAQTALVASGRTALHQELGLAGIATAALMLAVGIIVLIHSIHVGAGNGFADAAKAFAVVPFSAIVLFAALFAVAIAKRRDSALHKRVMLVATASLLQPAIGRWFMLFLRAPGDLAPPPVQVTIVPGLLGDLVFVAGMIYDRKTRGRVHPAYWFAGGAVVAVQLLRIPLSTSGSWRAIADWLAAAAL
jgi:hypothetical protein